MAESLRNKGYEVLNPLTQRLGRPGSKSRFQPIFCGYVFALFDCSRRLPVLTTPGVVSIVGHGKTPVPLNTVEIQSLQILLERKLPMSPAEFTIGERVRIVRGPLAGAVGVLIQTESKKLIVSITLLRRSLSVALPEEWLESDVECFDASNAIDDRGEGHATNMWPKSSVA